MLVMRVRNVEAALRTAILEILPRCSLKLTRNGPAWVAPEPVTTVYEEPTERVLLLPARDANPFFHLLEALWMLAGRQDLATVERYVKRMREYSDDGETLRGAYGHRWRSWFGVDQVDQVILGLVQDPSSRRVGVISMWDPPMDLLAIRSEARDIPCNLVIHFNLSVAGDLDMTVFCRSNDAIWGAYGANAVHFSILHEYVAAGAGLPLGVYRQISDNWHAYDNAQLWRIERAIEAEGDHPAGPYAGPIIPLVEDFERFRSEVGNVVSFLSVLGDGSRRIQRYQTIGRQIGEPFLQRVAWPLAAAHAIYAGAGAGESLAREAIGFLEAEAADCDWKVAAIAWLERRAGRSQEEPSA